MLNLDLLDYIMIINIANLNMKSEQRPLPVSEVIATIPSNLSHFLFDLIFSKHFTEWTSQFR